VHGQQLGPAVRHRELHVDHLLEHGRANVLEVGGQFEVLLVLQEGLLVVLTKYQPDHPHHREEHEHHVGAEIHVLVFELGQEVLHGLQIVQFEFGEVEYALDCEFVLLGHVEQEVVGHASDGRLGHELPGVLGLAAVGRLELRVRNHFVEHLHIVLLLLFVHVVQLRAHNEVELGGVDRVQLNRTPGRVHHLRDAHVVHVHFGDELPGARIRVQIQEFDFFRGFDR